MMLKTAVVTAFALLVYAMFGCKNDAGLSIEPINKELNEHFITGERLDTNYFSTRDIMQYYEISNFSNLPSKKLLAKLSKFTASHYKLSTQDTVNKFTILFYRKRIFVDYSDHLYEDAMNNESRALDDYSDDLIARIEYEKLKKDRSKAVITSFFHDPKGSNWPLEQDTIILQ